MGRAGKGIPGRGHSVGDFEARAIRGLWRIRTIKERERIRARTQGTSLVRPRVSLVSPGVLGVCSMRMYLETVTC